MVCIVEARAAYSTLLWRTLVAFVSGSFFLAISSTCALVTLPTLSLLGLPDPVSTPARQNQPPCTKSLLACLLVSLPSCDIHQEDRCLA